MIGTGLVVQHYAYETARERPLPYGVGLRCAHAQRVDHRPGHLGPQGRRGQELPRPACRPEPAAGAARPGPTRPPPAPRHNTDGKPPPPPASTTTSQAPSTTRPCPETPKTGTRPRRNSQTRPRPPPTQNVRPKREDKSRSNVRPLGAGERVRTADLPFTRSVLTGCTRASCTDGTGNRTEGSRCAGIVLRVVPRNVPR